MGFALILSAAKALLGRAWSFVTTPPGCYVAMAAAAALAVWLYGHHEYGRGVADCRASQAKASHHEVARQVKVGAVAVQHSNVRTEEHAAQAVKNKAAVRTIYVHDQAIPDARAVCVDPDDADRLRGLR